MFERELLTELERWSESKSRKPLVLRGARQTGKTSLVNLFSKKFDTYIYLNLELNEEANLFRNKLSINNLYQAILLEKNIIPQGKVLLFIDEIQNSPEAVSYLRYFYEQLNELFVISAGSLLEVMIDENKISFPVGRVDMMFIYPCSFREFLVANKQFIALKAFDEIPVSELAFKKLFELFHKYTLIGGMPEVIDRYTGNTNLSEINLVYQSLLTSYLDDIGKYARNKTMEEVLKHCLESSPYEASQRITFAGFGKSNYGSREVGEAIRTLQRTMVIHLIYPSTSVEIPIIPDFKKSPRLQFIDTGLINYFVGLQSNFFNHNDLHSFYRGLIAEHIVGQEIICKDINRIKKQCFWVREKSQSNAEVDFIIQHNQYLIPVEVKAGKSGTLKSLHQFMNMTNHKYAVRLYSGNLEVSIIKTPEGKEYKLLSLPYFLASKIHEYLDLFID